MQDNSVNDFINVASSIDKEDLKNIEKMKSLRKEGIDIAKYQEEGGALHQESLFNIWDGILVNVIVAVPLRLTTSVTDGLYFRFMEQDESVIGECSLSEFEGLIGCLKKFKEDVPLLNESIDVMVKNNLNLTYQSLDYKVGGILLKGGQAEKKGVFTRKSIAGFEISFANGRGLHKELGDNTVFELNSVLKEGKKLQESMVNLLKLR